jgi:high-affinity iron transporter
VGAAFLITLREGIEAALIVSILLGYLKAVGRTDRSRTVWLGVGAAAIVSAVSGAVLFYTSESLSETAAEAVEGVASLLAVGVLTWMIFWMRRQARFLRSELEGRVDMALASGSTMALAALSFFVVVREGLETVLFLFAADGASDSPAVLDFSGAVLGLAVAFLLGYLLYRGSVRLNLRSFFKVTGALILVVAAGLLANGVHELQEIGWIAGGGATAFDIGGTFSDEGGLGAFLRAMFGYNADPAWLELGAWLSYLVVTGFLFFRPQGRPEPRPAAPSRERDTARRAS